ncbi:MAG: alpha/beta hydrolase [Planctomycetota bacterium]|nr:alpha/beta hydrolase [Planctomycetota bacterium]
MHRSLEIEERRIVTDDGIELYVRRQYDPETVDEIPIVCCNGVGVSTFFWAFVQRDFSPKRPVIVWDYRGHGQSDFPPDLDQLTMDRNAKDLLTVLDALNVKKAVLMGHSMGCQVILEFDRRYPSRVAALVPMLGTHGRPIHTFFDQPVISLIGFRILHKVVMSFHERLNKNSKALFCSPYLAPVVAKGARFFNIIDGRLMPQSLLLDYLHHLGNLDQRVFVKMVEKMAFHSVEDHLPNIKVPVLVVAATRDYFTPLWLSEEMADRIPEAELLIIPEGSHAAQVEQPELVSLRLKDFFRRLPSTLAVESSKPEEKTTSEAEVSEEQIPA